MGRLTVRCPRCYHSFVFDPEDPASFRGGRYDLPGGDSGAQSPRSVRGFFRFLENKFESIKSRFSRNRSYGWQNPDERQNYNDPNRTGFGPLLAKYILFILILIGIARACFFSTQSWNDSVPNWNTPEPQEPSVPTPGEEDDKAPQVEI
ncbi:hypothetical protein CH352_06555 [Leptospira hartskeerlii]|uniref:Uncharacterized protein n=1 Tax=Leptospira hartskeerlii TaxID=2023177 RepID=A0A2M9XFV4_9LEPT|nr:hypothetical protein CH357_06960 [Leptospira hartskeerlii]PJZ34545.1 hypothetical protein CH352_06555 [Leptospira hartskeerlii]